MFSPRCTPRELPPKQAHTNSRHFKSSLKHSSALKGLERHYELQSYKTSIGASRSVPKSGERPSLRCRGSQSWSHCLLTRQWPWQDRCRAIQAGEGVRTTKWASSLLVLPSLLDQSLTPEASSAE